MITLLLLVALCTVLVRARIMLTLAGAVVALGGGTLLGCGAALSLVLGTVLRQAGRLIRLFAVTCVLGPIVLLAMIGGALIWGLLTLDARQAVLAAAWQQHHAIALHDRQDHPAGVLPPSLMAGDGVTPAYVAPITPDDAIPPLWWSCAVWLEDRHMDAFWRIDGIDSMAALRGYVNLVTHRQGGSTLPEMNDRTLRDLTPHPSAGVLAELPRKLTAWADAPALTRLFPTQTDVARTAATLLPLVAGAPGSHFGSEAHGLALAAEAAFGTSPERLAPAAAALLAAAINRPLLLAPADDTIGRAVAADRFAFLKTRADRCLAQAPLPAGVDRAAVRRQLAALPLPGGEHRMPASIAPAVLRELPNELARAAGPDWRRTVATVQVPTALPGLAERFQAELHAIEQRLGGRLEVPLWEGENHALILGAVTDAQGAVIAEVSNAEGALAGTGPLPIGSVGKIAAAFVLGRYDTPASRYCVAADACRHSLSARQAFARSDSPAILARLAHHNEQEAEIAFAALGWPAAPAGSARYNAAYGTLEVRPADVLRTAIAVTGLLAGEPAPAPLPHVASRIAVADGTVVPSVTNPLEPDGLEALATPRVRAFAADVLAAPLHEGTLRKLAWLTRTRGVVHSWGKTGTADAADRTRTRLVWQVGGLIWHGHPLSFLLLVAGSNDKPLGHLESSEMTGLTDILLRAALHAEEETTP